jgi:hypothetical protein
LNDSEIAAAGSVLLPFLYLISYTGRMFERSRLGWVVGRVMVFLGFVAPLIVGEARAADTGNGSKNFNVPQTVPNYFSNEAGPMMGPASETQRGPLYMGQTYGQLQQSVARPAMAEAPSYRQRVAFAVPRGRLIRGRGAVVPHHVIVHGRPVYRIVTRGSTHTHTAYVARGSGTRGAGTHASHTTRVSSSHRRARG